MRMVKLPRRTRMQLRLTPTTHCRLNVETSRADLRLHWRAPVYHHSRQGYPFHQHHRNQAACLARFYHPLSILPRRPLPCIFLIKDQWRQATMAMARCPIPLDNRLRSFLMDMLLPLER